MFGSAKDNGSSSIVEQVHVEQVHVQKYSYHRKTRRIQGNSGIL
jgi:hypothetical protein